MIEIFLVLFAFVSTGKMVEGFLQTHNAKVNRIFMLFLMTFVVIMVILSAYFIAYKGNLYDLPTENTSDFFSSSF